MTLLRRLGGILTFILVIGTISALFWGLIRVMRYQEESYDLYEARVARDPFYNCQIYFDTPLRSMPARCLPYYQTQRYDTSY